MESKSIDKVIKFFGNMLANAYDLGSDVTVIRFSGNDKDKKPVGGRLKKKEIAQFIIDATIMRLQDTMYNNGTLITLMSQFMNEKYGKTGHDGMLEGIDQKEFNDWLIKTVLEKTNGN